MQKEPNESMWVVLGEIVMGFLLELGPLFLMFGPWILAFIDFTCMGLFGIPGTNIPWNSPIGRYLMLWPIFCILVLMVVCS